MRKKAIRRPLFLWGGTALLAASVIAFAVHRTAATAPPLWTETDRSASVGATGWVSVAKADTPAVVNISTARVIRNPMFSGDGWGPFQDFFRHFFGNVPRSFRAHSLGSGFIIRQDGYVVTNNHVVGRATDITVRPPDGRRFPAEVVGRDRKTDLALLKIEAKGLPVLPFGDSDKLEVGEPVMAIGNPFGLEGTVTRGIVSGKGRVIGMGPYDEFIQTDASINPGNSGGPLVNAAGQVVGINTAIFSRTGGSMGLGFAIPINVAKAILLQLHAKGYVTRGWLGVTIQPVTPELATALHLPEAQGALVSQVMEDSPAAQAGLQAGDVIVGYDGRAVTRQSDLPRLVAATPVGRDVTLQVVREGKPVTVTARIAELSEPQRVASLSGQERLGVAGLPLTPALARQLGVKDRPGEPTLLQIHRPGASFFVAVTVRG